MLCPLGKSSFLASLIFSSANSFAIFNMFVLWVFHDAFDIKTPRFIILTSFSAAALPFPFAPKTKTACCSVELRNTVFVFLSYENLQKYIWQYYKLFSSEPQWFSVDLNLAPKIICSHIHDNVLHLKWQTVKLPSRILHMTNEC